MFDYQSIRNNFPILQQVAYKRPLVYFDNAATTQKPSCVIEIEKEYYSKYNSNIHRGVHFLSEKMTRAYEDARETVRNYMNARFNHEIIFTSGTTDAVNLVAFSFGEKFIGPGDEVIVTRLDHHSNIVPWQMMCARKGAFLKAIDVTESGELKLDMFDELISSKTKIIAINHVSNSLGTINPIEKIIEKAHSHNVPVFVDGAQGIHHCPVDVQKLDCDFYAFSGHKIYGPNGIGVLYGKEVWLNTLPPFKGGGDMIKTVSIENTTYNDLPFKFEAGTTNYMGAIGLAEALNYVEGIGREKIFEYEKEILNYAIEGMKQVAGIRFIGTAASRVPVISFLLGNIHHYDTGMMLDKMDIAVRTGNHCTQPLMRALGIEGTVRASFSFYNTKEEVDYFIESLNRVNQIFS